MYIYICVFRGVKLKVLVTQSCPTLRPRGLYSQWGRRVVEIEVIEWGSSRLSMEKLADRRGYKHCRQMYAALQEQSRHRNTAKRR